MKDKYGHKINEDGTLAKDCDCKVCTPTPPEDSDFSKFMRSTGPEKERVMLEVAKAATERQKETITSPGVEAVIDSLKKKYCNVYKDPEGTVHFWLKFRTNNANDTTRLFNDFEKALDTLIQEVREEERGKVATIVAGAGNNNISLLDDNNFTGTYWISANNLYHRLTGKHLNQAFDDGTEPKNPIIEELIEKALTPDTTSNK